MRGRTGESCLPVSYTHLDVYKRQRYLIAATAREQQGIEIIFTGLRPGDKIEELLSSSYESALAQDSDLFSTVQPERMAVRTLHGIMEQITLSVRQRDLRLLLESICKAVPEYRPGPMFCSSSSKIDAK